MDDPQLRLGPLFTDQYELVMAYGYWQLGKAEQEAVFHAYFRRNPFQGNYTICCGLGHIIDFIQHWKFSSADINYLRTLTTPAHTPLFSEEFLIYLQQLRFTGNIDAVPEGSLIFPHEPLLRVQGPLLQCQLLETAIVNALQFSSLIATKASRVSQAAHDDEVIEFGLRRAQGPNGGLQASRAAFIGGCGSTSNTAAGQYYGIPVKGTQAHSWIMAFSDEASAFDGFAQALPDNLILLVDTYHSLQGVQNAIDTGLKMRAQGHQLLAIRLDSGNLAELSKTARLMLDAAGLTKTQILASGDLDEYSIAQYKAQDAKIDIWGVGTRLVTAYDQPALDMVYKLAAIKNKSGHWDYKIKISDSIAKATLSGILQVRRYFSGQKYLGDVLYDVEMGLNNCDIPFETKQSIELLQPIFQYGNCVYQQPNLPEIRTFCRQQLAHFLATYQKISYPLIIEPQLEKLKRLLSRSVSTRTL